MSGNGPMWRESVRHLATIYPISKPTPAVEALAPDAENASNGRYPHRWRAGGYQASLAFTGNIPGTARHQDRSFAVAVHDVRTPRVSVRHQGRCVRSNTWCYGIGMTRTHGPGRCERSRTDQVTGRRTSTVCHVTCDIRTGMNRTHGPCRCDACRDDARSW
jgi:hypothetical protein